MKQMKSFVLASSAMLLMIGSIGVVAISCFCNDDQVSLSFFATTTTPCDDHTKPCNTVEHVALMKLKLPKRKKTVAPTLQKKKAAVKMSSNT